MKTLTLFALVLCVASAAACSTGQVGPNNGDSVATADGGPTQDSKIGGTDAADTGSTDNGSVTDKDAAGGDTDITSIDSPDSTADSATDISCPKQTQSTAQTVAFHFIDPRADDVDCVEPYAATLLAKLAVPFTWDSSKGVTSSLTFVADNTKYPCKSVTCLLYPQIFSSMYNVGSEYIDGYGNDPAWAKATPDDLAELKANPVLMLYTISKLGEITATGLSIMSCDETKKICAGRSAKKVDTADTSWYEFQLHENDGNIVLELTRRYSTDTGQGKTIIYTLLQKK